jgi:hypothetical protein
MVGPEDTRVSYWSQRIWIRGRYILRFEAEVEVVHVAS